MARIEKSIDVNVPLQAVYIQLTEFEEYPSFMEQVEEVRLVDDSHLHWRAKKDGQSVEWDSEITELVPDRSIGWRNVGGARNEGWIMLQPLGDDRTRVNLAMELEPGLAEAGEADAAAAAARRTEEDLVRFKKFVERLPHRVAVQGSGAAPVGERAEATQAAGIEAGKAFGQSETERHEAGSGTGSRSAAEDSGQADTRSARGMRPPWLPNLLQAWEEPLSRVRKISDEMDEIAQRYIGRPLYGSRARQGGLGPAWTPAVEITRHGDQFVVCAELPGVKREDVQIEIKSAKLTIEGDRHQAPEPQPEFRRTERSYGHFYRVVALPEGADEEGVSASMHDGLLEIKVPLAKEGQAGKRVDIR